MKPRYIYIPHYSEMKEISYNFTVQVDGLLVIQNIGALSVKLTPEEMAELESFASEVKLRLGRLLKLHRFLHGKLLKHNWPSAVVYMSQ